MGAHSLFSEKIMNINTIINQSLCVGCGLCISEENITSAEMQWNKDGFLEPNLIFREKAKNQTIDRVCPFSLTNGKELDEDHLATEFLKTSNSSDEKIGSYNNLYVGYSLNHRQTSSSGGIATYLFEQLLKKKIVNHIFVVGERNGRYEYQLFNDVNEVRKSSKTRYYPVTLASLFTTLATIEGTVAISGVACFIKAIRLKQHFYPELKEKIPFLVGIICGGLKSQYYSDYLAQNSGCTGEYTQPEYRIKNSKSYALDYSFSCTGLHNGEKYSVAMQSLGDMWGTGLFKSNACDFCDDVTTELADISLGDAWLKPYDSDGAGNNIIITRSKIADNILKDGMEANELHLEQVTLEKVKQSQQGSFNHRHAGLYYRLQVAKKQGITVPQKRSRFIKKQPMLNNLVQKLRMTVRAKSLHVWRSNPESYSFNNKITPSLYVLRKTTSINHRVNRLYKIIGIKK